MLTNGMLLILTPTKSEISKWVAEPDNAVPFSKSFLPEPPPFESTPDDEHRRRGIRHGYPEKPTDVTEVAAPGFAILRRLIFLVFARRHFEAHNTIGTAQRHRYQTLTGRAIMDHIEPNSVRYPNSSTEPTNATLGAQSCRLGPSNFG